MTAASSNFSTLLSSINCLLTSETLVPCLWYLHSQFSFSDCWCSAASASSLLLFSGSHWHLSDPVVLLLSVASQTPGLFTGSFPFSGHNPYFIVILWSQFIHYIHFCIAHVWNNSLNANAEFRILKSKLFLGLILLNFTFFHFNAFLMCDCIFVKLWNFGSIIFQLFK